MDNTITVIIQSPRGKKSFTFEKTTKVAEVIETARTAFGFEPGSFSLKRQSNGELLAPERPLVSYHLAADEVLLLVPEMGSGV
jgi:hypothetical protein